MYNKQDVIDLLNALGINFTTYSEKVLEDVVGEEIYYPALGQLIINEKKTWKSLIERDMPQEYRFASLKNIVKDKYASVKHGLELLLEVDFFSET